MMRDLGQHRLVLDEDAIADVEGDASLLLRLAKVSDDEPPNVVALCRALTGHAPFLTRTGPEVADSSLKGRQIFGHEAHART